MTLAQLISTTSTPLSLINKKSLFCLTLFTCAMASASVNEEINKSYPFSNGGEISLSNVNGNVTVTACNCDQVEVNAEIIASSQKARERVEVIIEADANSIDIETRYQKQSSWSSENNVKVVYELSVPNDVLLRGMRLVNGNLTVSGVSGELEAELVNGTLKSDGLTANTQIQTVNGEVDIKFESLSRTERIDLESVNGSIRISLPSNVNADVRASTVNGRISNEFGIEVGKGKYVGRSMRGRIGNGGVKLQLSNVNGAIELDAH